MPILFPHMKLRGIGPPFVTQLVSMSAVSVGMQGCEVVGRGFGCSLS